MRGVILAAGRGARLNGGDPRLPKCLVQIGGETLLARNVRMLRAAGIDELVVVIGCAADRVRRSCRDVTFVENVRFAQTNSLYSLWLTRALLRGGFVVMNCDILAHPQLLTDLLSARYEDALLVAYRDDDQTVYGDEEMKVRVRCGRVAEISKMMAPSVADGENVGIVKFGGAGAQVLIDEMDRLMSAGADSAWVPSALERFAARRPLHAIGTRGFPWTEIDFPEDYRRAVDDVLPRIEHDLAAGAVAPAVLSRIARPA
jgi:choline kinase